MHKKIIIAGSRDILEHYKKSFIINEILSPTIEKLLSKNIINKNDSIEIISGKCAGMDSIGEEFAKANGWIVKEFPADWTNLGKKAGPIRNQQMIDYGPDVLICVRLPHSVGSKDIIERARRRIDSSIKVVDIKLSCS